jgi:hypothetical protein
MAGVYSVTVAIDGCPSPAATTNVAVLPAPALPAISAPASALPGATGLVASVTGHAGNSYAWAITNGSIVSGNGTNTIVFSCASSGTAVILKVIETDGTPCSSAEASATVALLNAALFFPITPCRLFDTRNSSPASDAAFPVLAANETRILQVAGRCAIPSTARALSVNTTVANGSAAGELVLFRSDLTAPGTSNISIPLSRARANNGILAVAPDLSIGALNRSLGSVHFILDVNGYFQ